MLCSSPLFLSRPLCLCPCSYLPASGLELQPRRHLPQKPSSPTAPWLKDTAQSHSSPQFTTNAFPLAWKEGPTGEPEGIAVQSLPQAWTPAGLSLGCLCPGGPLWPLSVAPACCPTPPCLKIETLAPVGTAGMGWLLLTLDEHQGGDKATQPSALPGPPSTGPPAWDLCGKGLLDGDSKLSHPGWQWNGSGCWMPGRDLPGATARARGSGLARMCVCWVLATGSRHG